MPSPRREHPRRRAAAAALLAATGLGAALLATTLPSRAGSALARLVTANPADGSVAAAPHVIELEFDRAPDLRTSHVGVWAADGRSVAVGAPVSSGSLVRQPVRIAGEGPFRVTYHMTFADAADLVGELSFRVGAASTAGSETADTEASGVEAAGVEAAGVEAAGVEAAGHAHGGVDPISAIILAIDGVALLIVLFLLWWRKPHPAPTE